MGHGNMRTEERGGSGFGACADPILEELGGVRDRLAARFDYDVDAIFQHIKAEEAKSGLRYVQCPPRRLCPAEHVSVSVVRDD